MKLYIAEKPSLGRAIAAALPKPHKNNPGFIQLGNGDVVSWCIGHILEQAEPETYDQKYKQWKLEHLPIVPEQWQLKPKSQTRSQLTVLRKLVKQADEIIHAGDPDREGQLLVDEVIDYLKLAKTKKSQVKRLLVSDLNTSAVKRSLAALKANRDFIPLSVSALARSRADWLYGINLTRTYTLQGQKVGFKGVLSVGRVQTPVLGLVVRRDEEIANFVSKPFYEVYADIVCENGESFSAKWQPSQECSPYMDDQDRVVVKALAENVVRRISGQPATVTLVVKENKKQSPPLPFNLSALQIDAAKIYSMNAKLVLDICQSLYEKHKLITYPRSDCRYLPEEQHKLAPGIINMLTSSSQYGQAAGQANAALKSKAFNDKKVGAHHAIVPTEKSAANIQLNTFEKNIYQLIVRQYLAQFYPAHSYDQTKVELNIGGGKFTASAKKTVMLGWKVLWPQKSAAKSKEHNPDEPGEAESQYLPELHQGDVLLCQQGRLAEKMTKPPQAFTDATLLAAMTGINRFVSDKALKKILKDTDGLGTEATRAGIIELLFKRDFLCRQGKQIHATEVGKALIATLPEAATLPDMTAQWEVSLNAISEKQVSYQSFMQPLTQTLHQLVAQACQQLPSQLQGLKAKSASGFKKKGRRRRKAPAAKA
ncbi:DNA topoisomerase III [Thalassomonas actiniarum]|uniref:DNA topoisomerase 3 n=1 Tax=Thalassomonas actiniarum TaxID=485447 RepID=A0AAF0C3D7_9GAMM|nr:DNA topoisomerase III [Thalassomonas actiniarum]WDD98574.1 DNA topoisomerase III [Thalassomonas actiniarum]